MKILLVEDEQDIAAPIEQVLAEEGYRVAHASDGSRALDRLQLEPFDLVISDIRLPKLDGLSLFRWIRCERPTTPVILMTAHGSISEAVTALRENAVHYLAKPFQLDELLSTVSRVAQQQRATRWVAEAPLLEQDGLPKLIGQCAAMTTLRERLPTIARSDAPVLIQGESGTGKELVARAIHGQSARRGKPFLAINCAAFPDGLIEAELFGHQRGAFTGADRPRAGRFSAADGGTIFLDEVFEMSVAVQAKLLRVLQEGVFQTLGSNMDVKVDVRILSATNANVRQRIGHGAYREDLYYRLKVLEVCLPPLRDRKDDLPLLIGHSLAKFTSEGGAIPELTARAWAALSQYDYPGNVRELEHAIRHALVLNHGGKIDVEHLPAEFQATALTAASSSSRSPLALSRATAQFEREYILQALQRTEWSKQQTADLLGISRKNLWEKIKRYNLEAVGKKVSSGQW
jgi:DNA-binding NtrC family response regulator